MIEFQLFRIKVYPSAQGNLFEKSKTPPEILKETIFSLPEAELRKGIIWHIGNISNVDDQGMYFRIGRTTKSRIAVYQDGNFADEEFETAPYTHVLLDIPFEFCAIARNSKLAPKTNGIANRFIPLLNESKYARDINAQFEIGEINDPEDFISHHRRAYTISKFWVTFSRSNSFDVNEDFIKPSEKLLDESGGEKGKIELVGSNLRSDSLEDLARSAASTGNDAAAWLREERKKGTVKKRLKGNPVTMSQEDVAEDKQKKDLLHQIRRLYQKIRGASGKKDD